MADLSNWYLDVIKDRLYVSSPDSFDRRAAQTVLHALVLVRNRSLSCPGSIRQCLSPRPVQMPWQRGDSALANVSTASAASQYLHPSRLVLAEVPAVQLRGSQAPHAVAGRRPSMLEGSCAVQGLLPALAPMVPHLAEDAWQSLPWAAPATSVFQAGWFEPPAAVAEPARGAAGGLPCTVAHPVRRTAALRFRW